MSTRKKNKKPSPGKRRNPPKGPKEEFPSLLPWLVLMPVLALLLWGGAALLRQSSGQDSNTARGGAGQPPELEASSDSEADTNLDGSTENPKEESEPGLGDPALGASSSSAAPIGREDDFQEASYLDFLNTGTERLREGKPREAIELYLQALEMEEFDEDIHYNLGLAYTAVQDWDKAARHYEKALELFPDYAEAHNNLGNLLARENQFDSAVEHLEMALDIDPEYAVAHNNLGNALGRQGKNEAALEHFQKAFELDPDYVEARFNMGNAMMMLRRFQEASNIFQEIIQENPDFENARIALNRLSKVQEQISKDAMEKGFPQAPVSPPAADAEGAQDPDSQNQNL